MEEAVRIKKKISHILRTIIRMSVHRKMISCTRYFHPIVWQNKFTGRERWLFLYWKVTLFIFCATGMKCKNCRWTISSFLREFASYFSRNRTCEFEGIEILHNQELTLHIVPYYKTLFRTNIIPVLNWWRLPDSTLYLPITYECLKAQANCSLIIMIIFWKSMTDSEWFRD